MVIVRANSNFMDAVGPAACQALHCEGRIFTLSRGQSLFLQGDPAWNVGIVTNGHLKLSTVGTEGRTELVRLWEPGEVVGLVAALERRRHIGTATAVDDAAVLVLGMDRFEEILTRHPEAYPAVIWQLARWVHLAVSAQCDQGVESISVRLARLLVSLCGECDTGAVMLDVRLTQEELAQAIGTSRESAARILRTWREDGILTTRRRNIEIHDVDRLISMAHRESELD